MGCQDSRDGVGCSRTRGNEDDSGLPGGPCIAIRHVSRTLLVPCLDEPDRGIHKGVEDRDRCPSGKPKDAFDAVFLQYIKENVGASSKGAVFFVGGGCDFCGCD